MFIHSIIDTDCYPIHQLDSPEGAKLILSSRKTLNEHGALALPGFIRKNVVATQAQKIIELKTRSNRMAGFFSPYSDDMSEGDNSHLAHDHPRRIKLHASHRFIAGDLIATDNPLKQVYVASEFIEFVSKVLGDSPLYPLGDELGCINFLIYEPGDENGWHFDTTECVISIPLQSVESGGEYQYIRNLRSPDDENLEGIRWRMENPDSRLGLSTADLSPGTLFFFKGLYTFHRVTKVEGKRDRIMAILSYHPEPDYVLSDSSKLAMYGREN